MRQKFWWVLTLVLTSLSLLLLVTAVAMPLWIWLEDGDDFVGVGLFNSIGLDQVDGDTTALPAFAKVNYAREDTLDALNWTAIAGLEISAILFNMIEFVLVIIYWINKKKSNFIFVLTISNSVIAWFCNVTGLVIFMIYHGDAVSKGPDISGVSFPWSATLAGVACIIRFFIIIFIYTRIQDRDSLVAIPAAADPKMALYPTSKTGNTNHFFQAAPYTTEHQQAVVEDRDMGQTRNGMNMSARDMNSGRSTNAMNQWPNKSNSNYGTYRADDKMGSSWEAIVQEGDIFYTGGGNERISTYTDTFNRFGSRDISNRSGRQDRSRPEIIQRETEADFLVTAKHNADLGVHRNDRYMSHTNKPEDEPIENQRKVLAPANFLGKNVKYNPGYEYRPFSGHVY